MTTSKQGKPGVLALRTLEQTDIGGGLVLARPADVRKAQADLRALIAERDQLQQSWEAENAARGQLAELYLALKTAHAALQQQAEALAEALGESADALLDSERHGFDAEHCDRLHTLRVELEGLLAACRAGERAK